MMNQCVCVEARTALSKAANPPAVLALIARVRHEAEARRRAETLLWHAREECGYSLVGKRIEEYFASRQEADHAK